MLRTFVHLKGPGLRQSQIFERDGLALDRSTLADWVGKSTALLEPLADAIGRHVLAAEAILADDTPIRMLAPGTGKTETARLWTYARGDVVGIFPNEDSIVRLIGGVLLEANDEWQLRHRYVQIEGMAELDAPADASQSHAA